VQEHRTSVHTNPTLSVGRAKTSRNPPMIKITQLGGAGDVKRYFEKALKIDDYYSEGHEVRGQFYGLGAERLNLQGTLADDQLLSLARGLDPHKPSEQLIAIRHGATAHRVGWQLMIAPPKSWSIAAAVLSDHRLLDEFNEVKRLTLHEWERFAMARGGGGAESVLTNNILGVDFQHLTARPADGHLPDPQLHAHCLAFNYTQRDDGKWVAVDGRDMCSRSTIEYLRQFSDSEFASRAQRLGYGVIPTKDGFELAGFNDEYRKEFSHRSDEIREYMAAHETRGGRASQVAALATRKDKLDISRAELVNAWRQQAAPYEVHRLEVERQNPGLRQRRSADRQAIHKAIDYALAHTTERSAVVKREDLEKAAFQHAVGRADVKEIREQIAIQTSEGRIVNRRQPKAHYAMGGITTPAMIELERDNVRLMLAGQGKAQPIAEVQRVRQWAASRGLSAEQTEAAANTLASNNWITAIEADAGAGKTYTVGAIRELAASQGWHVHGFAAHSGPVNQLRKVGIEADTIAHLLHSSAPAAARLSTDEVGARGSLWIVDESSLVDSRTMHQFLLIAQQHAARVISVGDQKQHEAIEAGRPVHQMIQAGMTVVRLQTIRRQKDVEYLKVVQQFTAGKPEMGVKLLDKQHRVIEVPDAEQRYQRIADDYLRETEAGRSVLVISPANAERLAINEQIRALRVEQGQVRSDGREHQIQINKELTKAQRRQANSYEVGDILKFREGHKELRFRKGAEATVEAIDYEHDKLTLRTSQGRSAELIVRDLANETVTTLEVYRPEQRVLAVGDKIQFRKPDHRHQIANNDFGTITAIDSRGRFSVRPDSGKSIRFSAAQLAHIDLGYAVTSHSSQGATVESVIANIDTTRHEQLVNLRQGYVSFSRGEFDLKVYTNDARQLARAISRNPEKEMAIEVNPMNQPAPVVTPEKPELTQSQQDHQTRIAHMRKTLGLSDDQKPKIQPRQNISQGIRI
jgi:conjugative relaxase-like TrwC/TraI family protein